MLNNEIPELRQSVSYMCYNPSSENVEVLIHDQCLMVGWSLNVLLATLTS